jgi:hypothetical protein
MAGERIGTLRIHGLAFVGNEPDIVVLGITGWLVGTVVELGDMVNLVVGENF